MGVLTFEDGSRYQGLFADDKMVGSNLKEIATVRGWVDDVKRFEDTVSKFKNTVEVLNKSVKEKKKQRVPKKEELEKSDITTKETSTKGANTYFAVKELETNM